MTDCLGEVTERLRVAGIESPRIEARLLWQHANKNFEVFESAIARRIAWEPLAYITGHKEFWSLDFDVGPGVLIPRPETETLIDLALKELPEREGPYRVLDLGTGTGCLLVALLTEYRSAEGVGIDSSEVALGWARQNMTKHGVEGRIQLVQGGWEASPGSFDMIVTNPPYVPTDDLAGLSPEVRDYEPRTALDGGPDGLAAYRAIAPVLKRQLNPAGWGLLEIGVGQHHLIGQIMVAEGLKVARVCADLAGIPRCLAVRAS